MLSYKYFIGGFLLLITLILLLLFFKKDLFTQQTIENNENINESTLTDSIFFNKVNKINTNNYKIINFPKDFLIGFSTAPYQFEGGSGFRGLCNWDSYLYANQGTLGVTGRDGTDFYVKYKSDLERMKMMGVNALRIGISWSRLFYDGENFGEPKSIGVEFYKNLIKEMIKNGIKPIICLMHWDYPLTLQNKLTTPDGELRALACTSEDKDKENILLIDTLLSSWKHYVMSVYQYILKPFLNDIYYISTINEINTITSNAYMQGSMSPGFSINRQKNKFGRLDDVYWSLYNLLLMHHHAFNIHVDFTKNLKKYPYLTIDNDPVQFPIDFDPNTGKKTIDEKTYNRAMDFNVFNVLDPLIYGKWSPTMEDFFSRNDGRLKPPINIKFLKGNIQKLIPFHYYFSVNINKPSFKNVNDYVITNKKMGKTNLEVLSELSGKIYSLDAGYEGVWPPVTYNIPDPFDNNNLPASLSWIGFYPEGAQLLADAYAQRYPGFDLIITECGISPSIETRSTIKSTLNDKIRITLYSRLLSRLLDPKKCTAASQNRIKGALLWSFSDNLEWSNGYASTFGTYYINFWGPGPFLARTPKISAGWFRLMTKSNAVINDECADELFKNLEINPDLYTSNNVIDINLLENPLNNVILLSKPEQLGYSSEDKEINGYYTNKIELSGPVRQDKPTTMAIYPYDTHLDKYTKNLLNNN